MEQVEFNFFFLSPAESTILNSAGITDSSRKLTVDGQNYISDLVIKGMPKRFK